MSGIIAQNTGRHSGLVKAATAAGGEWTLIKTLTASADATLSFVDGADDVTLDGTYDEYCFKYINIHPGTDDRQLSFQGSIDGGSNYNITITSDVFNAFHLESDSGTPAVANDDGSALQQVTSFTPILTNIGADNDQNGCGWLFLYAPASTTFIKQWVGRGVASTDDDGSVDAYCGGYLNTTSAVDAIQFKFLADGNIDSGTISLYGIG